MMVFRKCFVGLILISYIRQIWTHTEQEAEDFFFPLEPMINYCKLADECQHDFVMICGQDSLGLFRLFTDNCDLYEFNCDQKKQYRHVRMTTCEYELRAYPGIGQT